METTASSNPLFATEIHSGDSLPTDRHFHPIYEFYYLCSGDIAYFTDDRIITLTAGDLLVLPPHTLHKSIALENPIRKRILLYVDTRFLQELPEAYSLLPKTSVVYHLQGRESITQLIYSLSQEYETQKSSMMLKCLFGELLVRLSRQATIDDTPPIPPVTSDRILEVVAYLNEQYAQDISLSKTAEHFYMNPSYLSRLFKENTGFTFSEYLNKYRIKKAAELLADKSKNVTQIALSVGFNSTNHFCKIFKKMIGTSPLAYRRKLQAN